MGSLKFYLNTNLFLIQSFSEKQMSQNNLYVPLSEYRKVEKKCVLLEQTLKTRELDLEKCRKEIDSLKSSLKEGKTKQNRSDSKVADFLENWLLHVAQCDPDLAEFSTKKFSGRHIVPKKDLQPIIIENDTNPIYIAIKRIVDLEGRRRLEKLFQKGFWNKKHNSKQS